MDSQPEVDVVEKNAISQGLTIKNAFLFLVDWRSVMLKQRLYISESSEEHAPMISVVLTSIAEIMKNKIKEASTDVFGLLAFGAESEEDENNEWPRMRYIHQIQKLNAEGIKKLQKISTDASRIGNAENNLEEEALKSKYGFGDKEPVEFDKVLWAARNKLDHFAKVAMQQAEKSLYRLRVIVLTGDENPSIKTSSSLQKAKTQANDLVVAMKVAIDVMLFNDARVPVPEGGDIDTENAFFDQIVLGGDDEISYTQGTVIRGLGSSDDIIERFTWRTRSKRAVLRSTFTLGDGYTFGVAVYLLISKPRKPSKVELFSETNEPIKRVTSTTCELIGKNLLSDEIRYAYKLPCLRSTLAAGGTVYGFSKEEVFQMSVIGPRGIHLYGFKKRSEFKMQHIYKTPYFIHPNDQAYKGSSEIFTQLLYSMLKRDVIGIVKTALRKNEQTRFAALIPQEEKVDDKGRIIHPVGFFLFPLPFKNDLRHTWRKELPEAMAAQLAKKEEEEEMVNYETKADEMAYMANRVPVGTETARKFVRKLTMKNYHPRDFADPAYAKFYSVLESHAGISSSTTNAGTKDEDIDVDEGAAEKEEEEKFAIHPKVELIDAKQGAALRRFKAETMGEWFDGPGIAEMRGTKAGKRTREAEEKARVKREKKAENMEIAKQNLHIELYIDAYEGNDLNSFKKAELVSYMNAFDLKYPEGCRKLKKDALEVVEEHIQAYIAEQKRGAGGKEE